MKKEGIWLRIGYGLKIIEKPVSNWKLAGVFFSYTTWIDKNGNKEKVSPGKAVYRLYLDQFNTRRIEFGITGGHPEWVTPKTHSLYQETLLPWVQGSSELKYLPTYEELSNGSKQAWRQEEEYEDEDELEEEESDEQSGKDSKSSDNSDN